MEIEDKSISHFILNIDIGNFKKMSFYTSDFMLVVFSQFYQLVRLKYTSSDRHIYSVQLDKLVYEFLDKGDQINLLKIGSKF